MSPTLGGSGVGPGVVLPGRNPQGPWPVPTTQLANNRSYQTALANIVSEVNCGSMGWMVGKGRIGT